MTRETVDGKTQLEQLLELSCAQIGARQLRQSFDRIRDVASCHPRESLGDDVDLFGGQGERFADLPDRHAGPESIDHAAHRGLIGAVSPEDVAQNVLAAVGLDVDIDIRELLAPNVHESLE